MEQPEISVKVIKKCWKLPTFGGICMHLNDENGCTHPYVAAANAPLFKT